MMNSSSHKLVEVLCGFWFNPELNTWDSTYFGKYFELVEQLGYSEKQEQQGFQVKFEVNGSEIDKPSAQTDRLEPRMMFKNPTTNSAILMSANYISFHKLQPYTRWEDFIDQHVKPNYEKYTSLGLGKSLQKVQMLYLNRYDLEPDANYSDTFSFLPSIGKFGKGKERNLLFQCQYELDPNFLVQIKLNTVPIIRTNKSIFLECSCIAFNSPSNDGDWLSLVSQAHDKNNEVFKIITNKVK